MMHSPLLGKLDPAAEQAMRELIGGALRTQAVYVVAKLGVPDLLANGALTSHELASRAGAHHDTLRRVLRFLVTCGVFDEREDGRFTLTRTGEYLQTAHPRSMRKSAIRAGEGMWQTVGALLEAVRTGATPHELGHGAPFFERDAAGAAQFAARMTSSLEGIGEAVASSGVLRDARMLVDVGGGHGVLLKAALDKHPHLHGVLFDTPAMIDAVRSSIDVSRIELVAGDFFRGVPAGDVYLLSWILHDWKDTEARAILRACREAGGADARLLIVEIELPQRAASAVHEAGSYDPFLVDMQMLLLTGGKERTREEYRALLEAEGFELAEVTPVPSARGASLFSARAKK
ncbi:MAG: acetylserotonin O-methyltransferase [Acidobacteriota bacterium]|nr:acetylserotonin O-methyltransferase [Acidobacteriota bacterium]